MPFKISAADFERSPFTGMTWQHWVDAGIYLLEVFFDNCPQPGIHWFFRAMRRP